MISRQHTDDSLRYLADTRGTSDGESTKFSKDVFVFPVSFAQRRLWFLAQLEPDSPAYNLPLAFRLKGQVNVQALKHSLNMLIERHEVLHTTFSMIESQPVQVVLPVMPARLSVIDLNDVPESSRENESRQLMAREAQKLFDLTRGPLLRSHLISSTEEDHILLLTMHHIVSDGWSLDTFCRELSTLYNGLVSGEPSSLPDLPIQYADFTIWQREWLQGEILETQLNYWRKKLAAAPSRLELITDYSRPTKTHHPGTKQSLKLTKKLTEDLSVLSQHEGVTMFMALLTAFNVLLYRHTGQNDILVGAPIANRNRTEIENLIGFFVNTMVLRTDLSGNPSFRELLGQVRDVCLEAYDHQDIPFEKLVEELQPERNPHQSPFFQTMFTFRNAPNQTPELSGLNVNRLDVDNGTAKFDVSFAAVKEKEALTVTAEYRTDLFKIDTIARLLGHYQELLCSVCADPDQPIDTLSIMTETERHQLLVEWNDTHADYPDTACLHNLFEAQVECTPDEIAIQDGSGKLTYNELNEKANQLAHHLKEYGVGPEVAVGICFERSLETVIAFLGILKAGGAYVPLDPMYPQERLNFILEDCQASVIVTQKGFMNIFSQNNIQIICLDTDWPTISLEQRENPANSANPHSLAYIIYTSGSTGNPKGVMIEHRSIVNVTEAMGHEFEIRPGDRVLQFFSISFDMSVCEIFSCLNRGGSLILRTDSWLSSIQHFLQQCIDRRITVLSLPTAFWHEMCSALTTNALTLPPPLRLIIIGGDRVHPEHWARWRRTTRGSVRLLYGYGPTEATIVTTVWELPQTADDELSRGEIPIGFPIRNVQVLILDTSLQPVPIGVRGELYIGGINLARGYLNRPQLTREQFIPHPFSNDPDSRLYKTGDLAIYLPDGNIEFAGRIDDQVKIRGFRIEANEIETVLGRHPQVNKAVVTAKTLESGDTNLIAYVVPYQETTETASELRRFLSDRLPKYMIPTRFVFLESFPLNPSGKVDRQALPLPDTTRSHEKEAFVAASDGLELHLTRIWESLLNIRPIGIRDNFFDMGGHSLLAVRLLTEVEKRMGIHLSVASLFQGPTIEKLAESIRRESRKESWSCLVPLQPKGTRTPFFCVAPAGAEVIGLRSLAHSLGEDRPFYGLQLPAPKNANQPLRVSDMATTCIQEIESIQEEGPYFIGGTCMGGLVAFEMACQLQKQGEKVALLVLFDSSQPPPSISLRDYIPRLLLHHLPRGQMFYCLTRDLAEKVRKIRRRFDKGQEAVRRYRVWKAHERARRAYHPGKYPGRITLFQSREFSIRFPEYVSRWTELAEGGTDHHIIPASHRDLLDKAHIMLVAEKLNVYLQKTPENDS